MLKPHRRQPLWLAFYLHRTSGLLLAVFLPAHFYVLGLALNDAAQFDRLIGWSDEPIVKAAEVGLVFLLSVHFFGGLRLMGLEMLPWSPRHKTFAALAVALSFFVTVGFLLGVIE